MTKLVLSVQGFLRLGLFFCQDKFPKVKGLFKFAGEKNQEIICGFYIKFTFLRISHIVAGLP